MKTSCHNLPGISEVRYIPLYLLPLFLVQKSAAGVPISVERDRSKAVRIYGNPECTVEQADDNNGRVETATLTFSTLDSIPATGVAFLVKQASGQWYLIGCRERMPQVSKSYSTGEPSGEMSSISVEVTFKSFKALLPVAV